MSVFPLWTDIPPLPEGGAGWSQTGYSTPGCNPSWNARCTAFWVHGAGCPSVQFIIPVETDIAKETQQLLRHYYKPLIEFGEVVLWVPYCRPFSESRKCRLRTVTLTDETPILKFCWLAQKVGNVILKSQPWHGIPLEWTQRSHLAAPGGTTATREVFTFFC